MRLAGTITNQHDAAIFADYLLTLDIAAKVERSGELCDLWVFDEDQLARSREELAAFQADPQAERFRNAAKQADALRRERLEKELAARRLQTSVSRPLFVSSHGKRPITMGLLTASCVVYLLTTETNNDALMNKFFITGVEHVDQAILWNSSLPEIRNGEWWRLVTPIFLHLNIAHLVMNMLALIVCGTQIEILRGSKRMLAMVILFAIPSNLAQYYLDSPLFGGMSGVLYGMFGYIWMKARYEPWSGFVMEPINVVIGIVWFVLCWFGALGPIANVAHTVGFAIGLLFGYAPTFVRSFRKQS